MQKVRLYEGHLAKSGKSILEFGGHKLSHVSKVADKSDMLVHNESKVVLMSYPAKTDRAIVLDNLAENVHKLEHYLKHPESFEICSLEDLLRKPVKVATSVLELLPAPHNIGVDDLKEEPKKTFAETINKVIEDEEIDSSCVTGSCSSSKKKYNQRDFKWD